MKIFKNKEHTEEISLDKLDLGIVEAGETKEFEFYLVNDSKATLVALSFSTDNEEVKVISSPLTMLANGEDVLKLKCIPNIDLKEPIRANIEITGKEIYG